MAKDYDCPECRAYEERQQGEMHTLRDENAALKTEVAEWKKQLERFESIAPARHAASVKAAELLEQDAKDIRDLRAEIDALQAQQGKVVEVDMAAGEICTCNVAGHCCLLNKAVCMQCVHGYSPSPDCPLLDGPVTIKAINIDEGKKT